MLKIKQHTPAIISGLRRKLASDAGAVTAEYAVTVVAAVGFAGILVVVLRSGEVHRQLRNMIRSALSWRG